VTPHYFPTGRRAGPSFHTSLLWQPPPVPTSQVGPGVRGAVAEGDLVMPAAPFSGTWRAAAVFKAKALQKVGALPDPAWHAAAAGGGHAAAPLCREAFAAAAAAGAEGGSGGAAVKAAPQLPLEYLAASRELLTAYRLLEMGDLKVMTRYLGLRPGRACVLGTLWGPVEWTWVTHPLASDLSLAVVICGNRLLYSTRACQRARWPVRARLLLATRVLPPRLIAHTRSPATASCSTRQTPPSAAPCCSSRGCSGCASSRCCGPPRAPLLGARLLAPAARGLAAAPPLWRRPTRRPGQEGRRRRRLPPQQALRSARRG
jgi:hypothetical protein